jgi:hypothetical protein
MQQRRCLHHRRRVAARPLNQLRPCQLELRAPPARRRLPREPLPRPSLQHIPPHADTLSRATDEQQAGDAEDDIDMMEILRSWHLRGMAVD